MLTLLPNIDHATHNDRGQEFHPAMQEIRKCYNYNHKHDFTSLAAILPKLAAADAICTLTNAPAPSSESANSSQDMVSVFHYLLLANTNYK